MKVYSISHPAWSKVWTTLSVPAKVSKYLNVLGFLNINKQRLFASCTYDTDVVIEHFNLFASEITNETVAVIDNTSIHTSHKFKAMLEIWDSQGLKIFCLPPYSLQLNPIEQLWKFMKYYWIEFDAYKSAKHMQDYVQKVIVGYGYKFEINFR